MGKCTFFKIFGITIGAAIVFWGLAILAAKYCKFEVVDNDRIILTLVGILATFVVISNYMQVKEVKDEFSSQVKVVKDEFSSKISEFQLQVEEVKDKFNLHEQNVKNKIEKIENSLKNVENNVTEKLKIFFEDYEDVVDLKINISQVNEAKLEFERKYWGLFEHHINHIEHSLRFKKYFFLESMLNLIPHTISLIENSKYITDEYDFTINKKNKWIEILDKVIALNINYNIAKSVREWLNDQPPRPSDFSQLKEWEEKIYKKRLHCSENEAPQENESSKNIKS